MADDDKLFGEEDELDPEALEEETEDDGPELPEDEDEEEDDDDLNPKHLNSLGFGIEEEDF